jgi:hypothetical protein
VSFAWVLIKCSLSETPRLLASFPRIRFHAVPQDDRSKDDLFVLDAGHWIALDDPLLLLPNEREALQAISLSMATEVVAAISERVSATCYFYACRDGAVVREISVVDGLVLRSHGEPLPGEPALAEMTEGGLISLIEQLALPVAAVEAAKEVLRFTWEWAEQPDELEMAEFKSNWPAHLAMIKLAVLLYHDATSTVTSVRGCSPEPMDRTWTTLSRALGLAAAVGGERRVLARDGVAAVAGTVEFVAQDPPQLLLRTDEPGPGFALVGVFTHNEQVYTVIEVRLYGEGAPEIAAREEVAWHAWMHEHFPAPSEERVPE